jgi:hypothetical protein
MAMLFEHARGRPMLSFLASRLDGAQLAQALQPLLEVQTADGERFVLRWADTRVSEALAEALDSQHWSRFASAVSAWWVVQRHGALTELPLPAQGQAVEAAITLTDQELERLLELGEPDAVIQILHENFADVLPESHQRAPVHDEVRKVCALARRSNLTGMSNVVSLALAVRLSEGRLLDNVAFKRWLAEQGAHPENFAASLADWVDQHGGVGVASVAAGPATIQR